MMQLVDPPTPQSHGLSITLVLGDALDCGCCFNVKARTEISLPPSDDSGELASLVSHVGIQLVNVLKALAPEAEPESIAAFLSEHLRLGVTMALRAKGPSADDLCG